MDYGESRDIPLALGYLKTYPENHVRSLLVSSSDGADGYY